DYSVAADHECLGHAVDAPVDGRAPTRVDADGRERITERTEEAPRIVGGVLVVDSDELDARVLGERREQRMLRAAGHAGGGPDIDDGDLVALEIRKLKPGHRNTVALEAGQRRQREFRRGLSDQCGRQDRRVDIEPYEKENREPKSDGERQEDNRATEVCV